MDALQKIEIHFGLPLPAGYRNWSLKKYTDYRANKDGYLWVSEAEWIPPDEILEHDLWRPNIIPGLIPFAFTGGGDNWCWNTQVKNGEAEYEVLCCWHDDELADAFAPTFPAWFYRHCLDHASGSIANDVDEIRQGRERLRLWSERLSEIYPGAWAEHLLSLSETQPFEYKIRRCGFLSRCLALSRRWKSRESLLNSLVNDTSQKKSNGERGPNELASQVNALEFPAHSFRNTLVAICDFRRFKPKNTGTYSRSQTWGVLSFLMSIFT